MGLNIMGYIVHSLSLLHFEFNIGINIQIRRQKIFNLFLIYAIHSKLINEKISITKQESDYDLGYIYYRKNINYDIEPDDGEDLVYSSEVDDDNGNLSDEELYSERFFVRDGALSDSEKSPLYLQNKESKIAIELNKSFSFSLGPYIFILDNSRKTLQNNVDLFKQKNLVITKTNFESTSFDQDNANCLIPFHLETYSFPTINRYNYI